MVFLIIGIMFLSVCVWYYNREKDTLIASLQSQLGQLKMYIGDVQASNRSTSQQQIESDK